MASTSQPGRPERVAWNARLRTDRGCIFADVSNADTSAVVIRHQTNTHRSTTRRRVIRSSRASSRANDGFTIIARERVAGPKLQGPHSHPPDQPVPGPAGAVPSDWQT